MAKAAQERRAKPTTKTPARRRASSQAPARRARRPLRIDNVTVGNGVPFDVATDEIGGFHFQRIKLVDGTEGGGEPIAGTTAFGLRVEIMRAVELVLSRSSASVHTVTAVGGGGSQTVAAVNAARRNLTLHNKSSVRAWVRFGAGATLANADFPIDPGETYEMPVPGYTGIVTAIWEGPDAGDMRALEF